MKKNVIVYICCPTVFILETITRRRTLSTIIVTQPGPPSFRQFLTSTTEGWPSTLHVHIRALTTIFFVFSPPYAFSPAGNTAGPASLFCKKAYDWSVYFRIWTTSLQISNSRKSVLNHIAVSESSHGYFFRANRILTRRGKLTFARSCVGIFSTAGRTFTTVWTQCVETLTSSTQSGDGYTLINVWK